MCPSFSVVQTVPLLVLVLNIHNVLLHGILTVQAWKSFHHMMLRMQKVTISNVVCFFLFVPKKRITKFSIPKIFISGLLKASIRDPDPVVFLENEMVYGVSYPVSDQVLDKEFVLPIGKAKIQRPGKHVTIVAHSRPVEFALAAANELAGSGIEAEVINLRSIRPLDVETICKSVQKTNHLVTVEGGWPQCGMISKLPFESIGSVSFSKYIQNIFTIFLFRCF